MSSEEAKQLLEKYNAGAATASEAALLKYWYIHEASARDIELSEQQYQQIAEKMRAEVLFVTQPRKVKLWPRIAAVAAAIAVFVFGAWFYTSRYTDRHPDAGQDPALASYAKDIAPGKNTATLTLANGKVITLSDKKSGVVIINGKIAYSASSLRGGTTRQTHDEVASIPRNDGLGTDGRVQTLTATTPRGGTYQVTLPDGTHVWLNADSKISFPSQFNGKERRIMLSGEAYFEVIHNAKMPFRVESRGQVVEDIGTEFNINAYADEGSVKTTLVAGSARVSSLVGSGSSWVGSSPSLRGGTTKQPHNGVVLKPNQQSITNEGAIKVTTIDPAEAISWRNGDFVFNNESIENIMRVVSRWYNVEIIYEGEIPDGTYYAKVSRSKNISQVLRALELTKLVHFRIEGRKVFIGK